LLQGGLFVSSPEQEQFLTNLFGPKKWQQEKEVSFHSIACNKSYSINANYFI